MTDSAYLEEVRGLPRPSDGQIASFADYLGTAHSWYKHLPFLAPGVPFIFYLDPNAGRDKIMTDAGLMYRERTQDMPEGERFHYTWQPTADYLKRFGHLEYYANAGTSFLVGRSDGVLTTETVLEIQGRDGRSIPVPQPVHDAGTAFLTSVMHPLGSMQVGLDTHATRRRIPTAELVGRFVQFAYEVGASDLRTQDEELQLRRACRRWIKGVRRTKKCERWPSATWLKSEWIAAAAERERVQVIGAIQRMLRLVYVV